MKPKPGRRGLVRLKAADLDVGNEALRFLGRFETADLRRELEEAGILGGLAKRGHAPVSVAIGREDDEHRLLLRDAGPDETSDPPLIELRCAEQTLLARDLTPRPESFEVLSVLAIHWLAMQDPRAHFTPERPRLPGQRHPGLGLARPLILRIHDWARAWGKDALVNFPEYFHNAVFCSALYRFALPERQGRFEAMVRDLGTQPIAVTSAAVERGLVIEEPSGNVVHWEASEMVVPLTAPAVAWLESPAYKEAARRSREAVWYRIGGLAA